MKVVKLTLDPRLEGIKEMLRYIIVTFLSAVITYGLDVLVTIVTGMKPSNELELIFLMGLASVIRGLDKKWHEASKVTGEPNLLVKTLSLDVIK
jgi:hypothetical protein